jgi:dTDP-glucose 4,6-dehydratase
MSSKNYQPRKVLVTGGAGFIGANFVRYLLSHDNQVEIFNLDLLTYAGSLANLKNLPDASRHHFIQGNITDRALVEKILRENHIDTIVHFAAESHVDRSIAGPEVFVETNLLGTFILLEAARTIWLTEKKWQADACRFHHISTDEVYGTLHKSDPAFTEETAYAPNSPYSASKAGSDHLVRAYYHTYGLPVTTSNCSNNYGPYQHPEKFIPTIIRQCLAKQPIPVYGDGSNIRDWLYVEDHCDGIFTILKKGRLGETYNIGGQTEIDNLSLTKTLCQLLDDMAPWEKSYASLITFVTDRPGHDWRYAIDIAKISRELGWLPKESFVTGIQKTLEFYQ